MSDFEVRINQLQGSANDFNRYAKSLGAVATECNSILSQVRGGFSTRVNGIASKVSVCVSIKECQMDMESLGKAIQNVSDTYCRCENMGKEWSEWQANKTLHKHISENVNQQPELKLPKRVEWKTGAFNKDNKANGYTTVYLNEDVENAYVHIYTYNKNGKKTKGELHIILKDEKGNLVWEGDVKSGTKLRLGNDHKEYRVYVSKKEYHSTGDDILSKVISSGNNFLKLGENENNCCYWAINTKKDCYCID